MAYDKPIKEHGHLFTVDQYNESVDIGMLTDYDGYGYPVRENMADDNVTLVPGEDTEIPEDATHVLWFNR